MIEGVVWGCFGILEGETPQKDSIVDHGKEETLFSAFGHISLNEYHDLLLNTDIPPVEKLAVVHTILQHSLLLHNQMQSGKMSFAGTL